MTVGSRGHHLEHRCPSKIPPGIRKKVVHKAQTLVKREPGRLGSYKKPILQALVLQKQHGSERRRRGEGSRGYTVALSWGHLPIWSPGSGREPGPGPGRRTERPAEPLGVTWAKITRFET